jgi:beta-phosphoglucomutase-like phosphatase (HAD superfamily)
MRLLIDPESAMVVSVPTTHRVAPSSTSRGPRPVGRTALPRPKQVTREVTARSPHPLELQTISGHWQRALDAAQGALAAADGSLPASDLGHRRHELLRERQQTAEMLTHLANVTGARPMPWLSPVPVNTAMLGLPNHVRACIFDVEGVLTNGGALHAWAWGEVLDDLLVHLSDQTGWQFIPFDRTGDYRAFFDGRARLEGIHLFLESRGIRLPEGRFDDPTEAHTAYGLAKRKGEMLARGLRVRGVAALPGAVRYLEAAERARLRRAVVSASASTLAMLELAGLPTLIEERVDADAIRAEGLRSRPAPDQLLVACRRLGVSPEEAVTLTHGPAGIAAGNAAGLAVIGVGDGAHAELLRGCGAERVVPSLEALLDRRLAESRDS